MKPYEYNAYLIDTYPKDKQFPEGAHKEMREVWEELGISKKGRHFLCAWHLIDANHEYGHYPHFSKWYFKHFDEGSDVLIRYRW